MLRRLFNFACVISLLLCVGVAVLWVTSRRMHYGLHAGRTRGAGERVPTCSDHVQLDSTRSGFVLWWMREVKSPAGCEFGPWWFGRTMSLQRSPILPPVFSTDFHLSLRHKDRPKPFASPPEPYHRSTTFLLKIPHWAMMLVTSALPGWWVVRRWRTTAARRRQAAGRCARCGYDLRATPGRCPECGAAASGGAAPTDALELTGAPDV